MGQVVSYRPLTTEARIQSQTKLWEIRSGKVNLEEVFTQYFSFPCQVYFTTDPY